MTPEGRVKKVVNQLLKQLGSDCWRFMPVQTGYGAPSLDYMLCYKGHFIAIETKAYGKKLTPLQKCTKADMEAAGALVLVVDDDITAAAAIEIIKRRFDYGRRTEAAPADAPQDRSGTEHLCTKLAA